MKRIPFHGCPLTGGGHRGMNCFNGMHRSHAMESIAYSIGGFTALWNTVMLTVQLAEGELVTGDK